MKNAGTQGRRLDREKVLAKAPYLLKLKTFHSLNLIDVEYSTLVAWIKEGQFPYATKRGKHWYLNARQFLDWFESEEGAA